MTKRFSLTIIVLIILTIPAVFALFHPGFFLTDDGNWMVIRFSAFYEALRHGQFPVRFLPRLNHGYGYPVSDFLYPGFMYLGVLIHLIGFGFVNTIKVILGLGLVFSGFFSFLWLRKLFKEIPSLVGSLMYVYFPYHLWDVYKRGSVGEVLAMTIVPFIFWQIEHKSLIWISIGIALLILSHNTLALLFLPIIMCYLFIQKIFNLKSLILNLLLGLGLSAFFWMPAMYDLQFTVFANTAVSDFSKYFVSDLNLAGVSFAVIFLLSFFVLYRSKKTDYLLYFFLLIVCLSLFLAHPFSEFVWHILPLGRLVQFPFRFLSIAAFGSAFLTASVLQALSKKWQFLFTFILLVLICISVWTYLTPKAFQDYPEGFYATNEDTTTVQNEYMPKWVKQIPTTHPAEKVMVTKGTIDLATNKGNEILFEVSMRQTGISTINTVYFPGWHATIDGKQTKILYNNPQGLMQITIPSGRHNVKLKFEETSFRLFTDIISVVCLMILVILGFKKKETKGKGWL